jgi:N-acetyl-anhydromuramyl-L-alanine amidase AmpD
MQIDNKNLLSGDNIIQKDCPKNTKKFQDALPDTIIVHYTAGRSAESSANYLCGQDIQASAHLVIGREGEVYQLVPFDTIAWHAGESQYAGREWLNKYSIGIELDNAGPLEKIGTEYKSWFGGRYQSNDVLHARHRNENNLSYWHTYTQKQIDACEEICLLLIEKYGIKMILGHEEIAQSRKRDPGPAFPLDKMRDELLYQNRSDEPLRIDKDAKVIVNQLNIRAGAGIENQKVALPLPLGKKVMVLEENEGWYKVETTITGWVGKAYIKLD